MCRQHSSISIMPNIFPKRHFFEKYFYFFVAISSMDGRPRPGLPSGKECCKQSDPEQSGCPSVRRLLDMYVEPETPSMSGEGERKFTESSTHKKAKPYGLACISHIQFFPQLINLLSLLITNLAPLKILLPKLLAFFFKYFSVCSFEVFAVVLPFFLTVKKDAMFFS